MGKKTLLGYPIDYLGFQLVVLPKFTQKSHECYERAMANRPK
jgi:hypothetical protein